MRRKWEGRLDINQITGTDPGILKGGVRYENNVGRVERNLFRLILFAVFYSRSTWIKKYMYVVLLYLCYVVFIFILFIYFFVLCFSSTFFLPTPRLNWNILYYMCVLYIKYILPTYNIEINNIEIYKYKNSNSCGLINSVFITSDNNIYDNDMIHSWYTLINFWFVINSTFK